MTKDRANNLLKIYSQKLINFRKNHVTAIPCKRLKNEPRIDIYLCYSKCKGLEYAEPGELKISGCRYLDKKIYLCQDLHCDNWLKCAFASEKNRKKACKGFKLFKDRRKLEELYNKFLLMNRVYRGLKIDPEKTLKWLDRRKKSGKLESKNNEKKDEGKRGRRQAKNKKRIKRKKAS